MRVERIGLESAPEWEAYVATHPDSTVYHRYAWRSIFGDTFGYRSFYVVARHDDGSIGGCVPLFLVTKPFSRRLVAVPFRDRGGLLWTDEAAFAALTEEAKVIAGETDATFLELKSTFSYPKHLIEKSGLREHRYWIRSTVDLRQLDGAALWKNLGSKTRNMIRQAEKSALELRELTNDQGGPLIWYELHLATQQRMGLPPFPLRFFRQMLGTFGEEGVAKLFAVLQQGQTLAATIVLLHRTTAIYGYSASTSSGQAFRPNDFMLFSVMNRLLADGFGEFDLGSDAPSQESLLFFKRKWLADQAAIPVYLFGAADLSVSDSSHPRYRLARRVFRHLPRPVLRAIGSFSMRFFG